MQEVFEKIIEKFKKIGDIQFSDFTKPLIAVDDAIEIVKQEAEQYNNGQTNADRIRSMTDEELANMLDEVVMNGIMALDKNYPCNDCVEKINCDICFLEWLQTERSK